MYFTFKSAVFSLIAMNFTPYNPSAEFAAFITFGTKAVNVWWVFGQVAAIALSVNDATIWVTLIMPFPSRNGSRLSILHFKGLL